MKRESISIPIASEIMQRRLHTVSADADLEEAVRSLLKEHHSGAPVVDSAGRGRRQRTGRQVAYRTE